jgi:hypothetical protein
MDTKNVFRTAGIAAVLICLVLLYSPTSFSLTDGSTSSCGSVINGYDLDGPAGRGCDAALNDRLTMAMVVGAVGVAAFAVGVAAFIGSTQINKREDD